MSDDLRERTPIRDQGDHPPEDGTRSDIGASDGASPGVQPGRGGIPGATSLREPRSHAVSAAGGYGTGSDVGSSGGSQERVDGSGSDVGDQTAWLREADDSGSGAAAGRDATNSEGMATRGADGLGAQGIDTSAED